MAKDSPGTDLKTREKTMKGTIANIEKMILANLLLDMREPKSPKSRKPIAPPSVVHTDRKKAESKKACRKKVQEED